MEIEHAENEERKSRNDRQLKTFFSTLIHLEQLKLGQGTTALINLVLSLRIARSDLPQLHTLDFEIPSNWKKPFDSKNYRYLNSYPSLCILRLTTGDSHVFKCNSRGGEEIENVKELSLAGINVDNSSTLSFIQNFPSLESLSLDTLTSHHADYSSLTASLPTSLTSLSLRNKAFFDGYSKPCEQHLLRLVNLESLYLSEGSCTLNLPHILRQLPNLRVVGFGPGAMLDCSKLEELTVGPNCLRRLEKVILDQTEGNVGWQIAEESEDGVTLHPDHLEDYCHCGPGWEVPQFLTPEFGDERVRELIQKIEGAGIVVSGTVRKALEVWDEWCAEVVQCEFAQVLESGSFDEIRERHGDKYVEDFRENWGFDEDANLVCECGECELCWEAYAYDDCGGEF